MRRRDSVGGVLEQELTLLRLEPVGEVQELLFLRAQVQALVGRLRAGAGVRGAGGWGGGSGPSRGGFREAVVVEDSVDCIMFVHQGLQVADVVNGGLQGVHFAELFTLSTFGPGWDVLSQCGKGHIDELDAISLALVASRNSNSWWLVQPKIVRLLVTEVQPPFAHHSTCILFVVHVSGPCLGRGLGGDREHAGGGFVHKSLVQHLAIDCLEV